MLHLSFVMESSSLNEEGKALMRYYNQTSAEPQEFLCLLESRYTDWYSFCPSRVVHLSSIFARTNLLRATSYFRRPDMNANAVSMFHISVHSSTFGLLFLGAPTGL